MSCHFVCGPRLAPSSSCLDARVQARNICSQNTRGDLPLPRGHPGVDSSECRCEPFPLRLRLRGTESASEASPQLLPPRRMPSAVFETAYRKRRTAYRLRHPSWTSLLERSDITRDGVSRCTQSGADCHRETPGNARRQCYAAVTGKISFPRAAIRESCA